MLRRIRSALIIFGLVVLLAFTVFFAATKLGWITPALDLTRLSIIAGVLELVVINANGLLLLFEYGAKSFKDVGPLVPTPDQRELMLNQVEQQWIKSVLERPIYDSLMDMLDLGVDNPITEGIRCSLDGQDRFTQSDADAMDIFNGVGHGHGLLILGDPGCGKTTTMLRLAREQIRLARENPEEPLPIVFTLSSWTPDSKRLRDWLVEELNTHYGVTSKTGRKWIKGEHLILLLDGLDEVPEDRRADCVRAINGFREQEGHGQTRMAVCCGSREYADLGEKLSSLHGSITIQPLTPEQVNRFLSRPDLGLGAVQTCIKDDEALRELTTSPLNLSIMSAAYAGLSPDELRSLDIQSRRKDLFDRYIVRIFEHSRRKLPAKAGEQTAQFTPGDTLRWLSFLAHQMNQHNLTRFLIERIQPAWLEDQSRRRRYMGWGELAFALGISLGGMSSMGLALKLFFGWIAALVVGLAFIVFTVLFLRLDRILTPYEKRTIQTIDRVTFSWRRMPFMLVSGMLFGLVIGPPVGLVVGLIVGVLPGWIVLHSLAAVVGWLYLGLIVGLIAGLSHEPVDVSSRPNYYMRCTLDNAIRISIIGGLAIGLPVVWAYVIHVAWIGERVVLNGVTSSSAASTWSWLRFSRGLLVGGTTALLVGVTAGFNLGGREVFKHYLLRRLLSQTGQFPKIRELIPFLEHADDLIFIQRTGGSYRFVHSLVQDHFADLTPEDINRLLADIRYPSL